VTKRGRYLELNIFAYQCSRSFAEALRATNIIKTVF